MAVRQPVGGKSQTTCDSSASLKHEGEDDDDDEDALRRGRGQKLKVPVPETLSLSCAGNKSSAQLPSGARCAMPCA
jgi:hypothetical protein